MDIVPTLQKQIEDDFEKRINENAKIQSLIKRLNDKKATSSDVSRYSQILGNIASSVLLGVLTEENLPNGQMYYNIAERTIKPLLKRLFEMVIDFATAQQKYTDEKMGLGINSVSPEFPEQRIDDLMLKFADIFDEETWNV